MTKVSDKKWAKVEAAFAKLGKEMELVKEDRMIYQAEYKRDAARYNGESHIDAYYLLSYEEWDKIRTKWLADVQRDKQ